MRVSTRIRFSLTMIRHSYLCLLVLGAASAFGDEQSILSCAAIADDVERLACYDRLGRRTLQTERQAQTSQSVVPVATTQTPALEAQVQKQFDGTEERAPDENDFGKPLPKVEAPVGQMSSRIAGVAVSPSGQRIMTLANGQIWMENEAGKRAIPMNENVTVSKRLFRYAMRFESGFVIAVRRAD